MEGGLTSAGAGHGSFDWLMTQVTRTGFPDELLLEDVAHVDHLTATIRRLQQQQQQQQH